MNRIQYSEAVTAYIPKEMKTRLLVLKALDPQRNSTSKIIEAALNVYLPIFEKKMRRVWKNPQGHRSRHP
jgi:hypothetical protein